MASKTLQLGRPVTYCEEYSPKLLRTVDRAIGRATLSCKNFTGFDLWRLYELTFLLPNGAPKIACGTLKVPADSTCIVESKSLKLYLTSFSQTKFVDIDEVQRLITRDLNEITSSEVEVLLYDLEYCPFVPERMEGTLIDDPTVSCGTFRYNPKLLEYAPNHDLVSETLRSNCLRTLCPVTGQPDYASVSITYQGRQLSRRSLWLYLCSLRRHAGFHEQCVEMIYSDIREMLKPEQLTVYACFSRRGGIDISPLRSNIVTNRLPPRLLRQ